MVSPGSSVHQAYPESAAVQPDPKNLLESYASSGGFSNIYPIPQYQKAAVENYFAKYNPPYEYYSQLAKVAPNPAEVNVTELQGGNPKALYNRIGRGVPDVAANGLNSTVVVAGKLRLGGGTSQSAPIFASVINRIVEERLAKGKKSLGFINPVLYAHPEVLNDIINGINPGCTSSFMEPDTMNDTDICLQVAPRASPRRPAGILSLGLVLQTTPRCWSCSCHCRR